MKTSDFSYELPEELIAQTPEARRDASRLLTLSRTDGLITHKHFYDLPDFLRPGDCLVVNESRVLPARLFGRRADTGTAIEVVLLIDRGENLWECLTRPGRSAREGVRIVFGDGSLEAVVEGATEGGNRFLRFSYHGIFMEVLERLGHMPLPPYIKAELSDPERYQTVYSSTPGSAAAPTAGLHFTNELLHKIEEMGVTVCKLLLHVGLGTFRPVKVEDIESHLMHSEYYMIEKQTAERINTLRRRGGRVIAVGTTSVRTLETVATEDGQINAGSGWTDIFIHPGYRFKAVDAMITNFHLPESTLIMLVCAFAGYEHTMQAYREAVNARYRFFSFGDAMFIH